MTARRGEDWGDHALTGPEHLVHDDRELAELIDAAGRSDTDLGVVGLLGGDLCRTLGGRGDQSRLLGEAAVTVPIDIGRVEMDDHAGVFVAHCTARTRWWGRGSVAVMNAAFLGEWNLAPRAHPNDGRLDALEVSLPPGDRWRARRRLPLGTHVPHPGITQRRLTAGEWHFDRARPVRLDGHMIGRSRTLRVTVEPDAIEVAV